MNWLVVAQKFAWGTWNLWLWSSVALMLCRRFNAGDLPFLRHLRMELQPFALPALVAATVLLSTQHMPGVKDWTNLVGNCACWLLYRKDPDDDDRWKRRRKKLASKVAVVGGRLEVVPAVSR